MTADGMPRPASPGAAPANVVDGSPGAPLIDADAAGVPPEGSAPTAPAARQAAALEALRAAEAATRAGRPNPPAVLNPEVAQDAEPDPRSVAHAIALRVLALRPHSRAELERKLARRGCDPQVAAGVPRCGASYGRRASTTSSRQRPSARWTTRPSEPAPRSWSRRSCGPWEAWTPRSKHGDWPQCSPARATPPASRMPSSATRSTPPPNTVATDGVASDPGRHCQSASVADRTTRTSRSEIPAKSSGLAVYSGSP